ncbi:hypothetical protein NDU88_003683 [Pleurodeles waltl]|uniref:Uncharacterized protein n=1 Tax=Pleurodeles waltl TaxID=8319 RepID=A0AAV7M702_PLEWA|nr:hypothetical protein NDU88_003683 [Pleurodeles waltl]
MDDGGTYSVPAPSPPALPLDAEARCGSRQNVPWGRQEDVRPASNDRTERRIKPRHEMGRNATALSEGARPDHGDAPPPPYTTNLECAPGGSPHSPLRPVIQAADRGRTGHGPGRKTRAPPRGDGGEWGERRRPVGSR